MLIDRSKFRAARFLHGVLFSYTDGHLNQPGCLKFVATFLLGAGNDARDETPRVTTLEAVATASIGHWEGQGLHLCDDGVLGMGASGVVLRMTPHADARTARAANRAQQVDDRDAEFVAALDAFDLSAGGIDSCVLSAGR